MQKILEIKNADWIKGISAQPNLPVGGLFQVLQGVDPFEQQGVALPALTPAIISPDTTPIALTNWNDNSGNAYVYAHTATKLYRILKDSPYTIVDVTAQITVNTVNNALLFDGGYLYAGTTLRFNTLPVASGSDVQIAAGFNGAMDYNAICIGADKNAYVAQNSYIGKVAFTSHGWTATIFSVDNNFNVRDMVNDGRYLVIIADNNADLLANRKVGNYRCRVYFWDMVKGTADIIYDIKDSYLIAARVLDEGIYIFGYKGLYVCNSASLPKMVRPMVGTSALTLAKPNSPAQLTVQNGSIYWIDGTTAVNQKHEVNAYGNPTAGQKKIFYKPYLDTGANQLQTVIATVGDQFWVGGDTPAIYVHNIGSTRGTAIIETLDTNMSSPFTFEYTKVVLSAPLTTGQSISHAITSQNGSINISAFETKSYNATKPKQSFVFKRIASGTMINQFENLRATITAVGCVVQRISIYATPVGDANEEI